MSKKILGITVSSLLAVAFLGNPRGTFGDDLKFGVVNVSNVFDGYGKSKKANEELNLRRNAARQSLADMRSTLQDLVKAYNEKQPEIKDEKLSAEKKEEVQKELDQKLRQIQMQRTQFQNASRNANANINRMINATRTSILNEITAEIKAVAKEQGFDYVFDNAGRSSTNVPPLLYHNGATDLTETLIERLNATVDEKTDSDGDEE